MQGKGKATTATRTSLLHKTQSWDMKVDWGGGLQFPQVVQTTSRLDPLLAYSPMGRQGDKYQDLLHDCSGEGGRCGCSWSRSVGEDSLPSLENAHSHQDDREGEKGSSSQDGGGGRQTTLPLSTHHQVVHVPSDGVEETFTM